MKQSYYNGNRAKCLASQKKYRDKNKQKVYIMITNWRAKHPEKLKEYEKRRYIKHKAKRLNATKTRYKNRYKTDINFRLRNILRLRIRTAVTRSYRVSSSIKLLGCSIDEFKQYLENKFLTNMTWSNYGDWHIDHKIPCVSFDLTKIEEQKKCFHYSNLQPLWAKQNLSKGCKVEQ
jgi:hypothetical protein